MLELASKSTIAGKYRLERLLARGGMGSVWVARHLQLDVEVAIKFMASEAADSAEVRVRFEREAKASAMLTAPNVVHVYDYGIEDDMPYLVMELLHGEDLDARLRREGRIKPADMVSIVDQMCKGLRRAHEAGLIHRDLKPANIFLARQGGEEVVKILDFGIAKSTAAGLIEQATRTGTLVGSPHYMSPEQVRRSNDFDHRSDLWAVGVLLFQCLTGRLPFPNAEVGDTFVDICTKDIPIPSQICPDLGPSVDRFLAHALMREADRRFQSARELAEAFSAMVARTASRSTGSPVAAVWRNLPWASRGVGAGSGLLIAIILVGVILSLGMTALVFAFALSGAAPTAAPSTASAPPPSGSSERAAPPPSGSSERAAPPQVPNTVQVSPRASTSAPSRPSPPPRGNSPPIKPKHPVDDPLDHR